MNHNMYLLYKTMQLFSFKKLHGAVTFPFYRTYTFIINFNQMRKKYVNKFQTFYNCKDIYYLINTCFMLFSRKIHNILIYLTLKKYRRLPNIPFTSLDKIIEIVSWDM